MYAQYAPCLLQFTHVTHFPRADCWDQFPWQPPIIWWLLALISLSFLHFFYSFLSSPGSLCSCEWASEPPTNTAFYPKCWSSRLVVYHTFISRGRGHDVFCLLVKPCCSIAHLNLSWINTSLVSLGWSGCSGWRAKYHIALVNDSKGGISASLQLHPEEFWPSAVHWFVVLHKMLSKVCLCG